MKYRAGPRWPQFGAVALGLTVGCGAASRNEAGPEPGSGGEDSAGGAPISDGTAGAGKAGNNRSGGNGGASSSGAANTGGSNAGSGGASGNGGSDAACDLPASKRLVRLSFSQISKSLHALFGDEFGKTVDTEFGIGTESEWRTFPPLASAREGSVIIEHHWADCDQIARKAGAYTLANLDAVAGCGAAPSEACARAFVDSFTEKVFRRPPTSDELASMQQVYSEALTIGASIPEALATTVSALISSPQFLYRTEFGGDASKGGSLDSFELASQLSYFLTDAPPDAELLDAAASDSLATRAELSAQATRILETPAARANFTSAVHSYFGLDGLLTVVIDDPAFTSQLRDSAAREAESFIDGALWSGPLSNLLTSRKGYVNSALASVYGVTLPPPPAAPSVFVELELPSERTGLLTRTAFLASRSRPDNASNVIGRGLAINAALICETNPPFPDDPAIVDIRPTGANLSAREQAEFRASQPLCSNCHDNFDAFGLALERYDGVGRYRSVDSQGRPIDPVVTLPPSLGGAVAKDAADMQAQIAQSPKFARCIAKNMLNWALMEPSSLTRDNCPAVELARAYTEDDGSMTALLRAVAASPLLRDRKPGE
ncbi:MAG TPA: DUF1592 domain-containing protein [Polyangiaceae bacterium]|nr:DUF1592 domain-containing protein [Polyangiaceae bacterium]